MSRKFMVSIACGLILSVAAGVASADHRYRGWRTPRSYNYYSTPYRRGYNSYPYSRYRNYYSTPYYYSTPHYGAPYYYSTPYYNYGGFYYRYPRGGVYFNY